MTIVDITSLVSIACIIFTGFIAYCIEEERKKGKND